MKTKKIVLLIIFFGILFNSAMASVWTKNTLPSQKVFIENKGQFVGQSKNLGAKILYSADFGPQVYFTKSGYICSMTKADPITEEEEEKFLQGEKSSSEQRRVEENDKPKTINRTYYVNMEWVGANPNAQIVAEDKVQEYWNYIDPANSKKSIDRVVGYKKMIYKNIYSGIDVEYTFRPDGELKYSLILHPGADASKVKMKYSGTTKIYKDASGNICFSTSVGTVTDHAPETFYESGRETISSSFDLKNNIVTFNLGAYDKTKPVIIDPWMNSTMIPVFTVAELSVDASNNVYVYGFAGDQSTGNTTLAIYEQKYNAAGALQWTFNFTQAMHYDQNTGDIVVDPAGNSYVTNGFFMVGYFIADCMQSKLDPAGTLIWNIQSPNLYENWRNAMNCDYTQLVQLGVGPGCCDWGKGTIINTTTGAESGMFNPAATGDIVSASYGKNGYLYMLSIKDDYAVNPPPNGPHLACLNPATGFSVVFNNLYPISLAFVDGFKADCGTNGFNVLAAGCNYLYVCLGATLEKRDLNTGALIGSVAVPGGVQHGNAGTAVDKCGNVYVGSAQGVYVFDPSLSLLNSYATPFPVLDICIGTGGMFYACGGTATSTTNTGFVAQFSMSSVCNPIAITSTPNSCGSSNIGTATATPVFCSAPYTYWWSTSPPQTTQTATGLGGGSYTVVVTGAGNCNEKDTAVVIIPAGLLITSVPPPTNVSCYGGNNGSANATATGGTSPYTYLWNPTGQTTQSATGLTAGTYSVLVTDAGGCTGSQTVTITQPPVLTATASPTSAASCGSNSGSATVIATGGTNVFTYSWNPSGQTTQSASGFTAGNYSVTVTDGNGCTVMQPVTVISTGSITATAGPPSTICAGQTATLSSSGGINYSWSSGQTTASVANIPTVTTTYSVIVSSGSCVDTAYVTVNVLSSPSISVSGNTVLCIGDSSTLTATGGANYNWNTGSTASVISVSPSTTTTYSVITSNGSCTSTVAVTVIVSPPPVAAVSNATICAGQSAVLTASGGINYSWSNGYTTNPILVSPASNTTYSVFVSAGSCSDTASATVVVNPSPVATAWSNVTITTGSSTTLSASGGGTYTWSNGSFGSNISVSPTVTTGYCVTVSNGNCKDTVCVTVTVEPKEPIDCSPSGTGEMYLPNAFSPNGDGENDILKMYFGNMQCIQTFEIHIYNRWGEIVYETTSTFVQWDGTYKGKPEGTAVFVYYMKAKLITGEEIIKKGNISLTR